MKVGLEVEEEIREARFVEKAMEVEDETVLAFVFEG